MPDADGAIARLYEDASLRDELTDADAEALYAWAESQIRRLAASSNDAATFEAQVETLRGLLKSLNRTAGRVTELDAERLTARTADLVETARAVGLQPAFDAQAAELNPDLPTSAPGDWLRAMLARLTPAPEAPTERTLQPAPNPATEQATEPPGLPPATAESPAAEPVPIYPGRTDLFPMPRRLTTESGEASDKEPIADDETPLDSDEYESQE